MRLLILTLSLLMPNCFASGSDRDGSSRLQVQIPKSLFKEDGGYPHKEALFGVPTYGGSISLNVFYADSDLCDPAVDTRKGYPIRPKDDNGIMEPWKSPYILMIDRGGCTFVQKVRNAQRSGAAAVVVANNVCLCSDEGEGLECHSDPGKSCEQTIPIMADDGSGADITIPSFLMYKQHADVIKAELEANHIVQMEMEWATPAPDDRVEYDLWTVPTSYISRQFTDSFRPAAEALGKHAYFTPHFNIYDGVAANCQGSDGSNVCYTLCTNSGRYCATDPDSNLDEGISGADVVAESLRRMCIWNHYGQEDGIGSKWWKYVEEFTSRCDNSDYFSNEDCHKDAYKNSGVDGKVVEQCISDSGGLEKNQANNILDAELQAKTDSGVVVIPSIFINDTVMRGALNADNVFKAICSGYLTGTEPGICKKCVKCGTDMVGCAQNKGKCVAVNGAGSGAAAGSISSGQLVVSLALLSSIFAGVGYWQYQRSQSRMRDEVRGILAEYMPLEEEGKDADGAHSFSFAESSTQIT